jgi:hypothetical protein
MPIITHLDPVTALESLLDEAGISYSVVSASDADACGWCADPSLATAA